ncbi:MAG: Stearoyl-CoA 9-desaturase [Chthoniobacteraceae bacterium]|nr:Stearoyl-CoA 9-desaturase [Chthoniobacteraceae bacterium]
MFRRIPFDKVNWITSSFLIGTLVLSLTAVPLYIWKFGLDWFQVALFFVMFCACGFSITLGYHRLYSHLSFQAHKAVQFFVLLFGAGAFENSALLWCCEHRTHHKFVDHDEDPYDINKGLFHAHIGWLLFKLKPSPPFDNVPDLKKDSMVMFQHRHIHFIGVTVAFILPAIAGYAWGGWVSALGSFLIAGVARVVFLQHCTFCINSLCHYLGNRPYSSTCSARDSWLMAIFTFGEGYHNYHHEFQHDYRNGVKPWQFDPTKWIIWTLSKLGLADKLRRVPSDKILLSELAEAQRRIAVKLESPGLPESARAYITGAYERLQATAQAWAKHKAEQIEITRDMLAELSKEIRLALSTLQLHGVEDLA